jgi:hypothetical protein
MYVKYNTVGTHVSNFIYVLIFNVLSLDYIHIVILNLLHFCKIYSCKINHLILLLILIFIGVLRDFLLTLDVFDGLMVVVWTIETGNHFNNIVV